MKIKNNKITLFILMAILLISSAFSVTLDLRQSDLQLDYLNNDKGNTFIYSIAGNLDNPISLNNNSYEYDFRLELASTNQPYYLVLENAIANSTLEIIFHGDLNRDPTYYYQEVTLNDAGQYIFKFTPTYESEANQVYLNYVNLGGVGTVHYSETKPKGFNALMESFVNGFSSLISFNIGIWKVTFYALIFFIVVSFVVGIFGFAFTVFAYSKRLKNSNKDFSGED